MSIRVVRFSLSFPPLHRWINPTRCYIADIMQAIVSDTDDVDRLAIAVHELLENCIKYSTCDQVRFEFEVNRDAGQAIASIRTTNSALLSHITNLRRRIDALNAASDPIAHYDEVIRESLSHGGSSLGLARVRAESAVHLSYQIQGDVVVVFGEMHLRVREVL